MQCYFIDKFNIRTSLTNTSSDCFSCRMCRPVSFLLICVAEFRGNYNSLTRYTVSVSCFRRLRRLGRVARWKIHLRSKLRLRVSLRSAHDFGTSITQSCQPPGEMSAGDPRSIFPVSRQGIRSGARETG